VQLLKIDVFVDDLRLDFEDAVDDVWDEALVVGVGPAFGPHYGFYEVQSGLDGF
jgi:hypothetical protein